MHDHVADISALQREIVAKPYKYPFKTLIQNYPYT